MQLWVKYNSHTLGITINETEKFYYLENAENLEPERQIVFTIPKAVRGHLLEKAFFLIFNSFK